MVLGGGLRGRGQYGFFEVSPPWPDEYWFEPPSHHPRSGIPRPGVLLSVLSEQALEHAYEIEIKLKRTAKNGGTTVQVQGTCSWKNTIIARLEPISQWWSEGAGVLEPPPEQFALPDLDLHAYTPDGKHVGMNYETGIFEMQIPGVIASGGFYNSSEWISVPEDSAAYFVISSRPTALFLEEHPDLPPENEEGLYALSVSYFDENLDGVGSGLEELTIAPGAEVFHLVEIRLMPDDNYQLEIREGLDLMSLEAWEAAVDNIPDELFINNPSQRKGALKNKLRAIFAKVKKKTITGSSTRSKTTCSRS